MITTLALISFLQTLGLDQKVDYRTVAKDVPLILADLRKQTGVKFDSRGIKNTPVVIVSKGLPLQTLMDRVAEVTDSVWSHESDRYILTRPPGRIQEARKREMRARGQRIKDDFLKPGRLPAPKLWTEEEARNLLEADRVEFEKNIRASKLDPSMQIGKRGVPSPAQMLLHEFIRRVDSGFFGALEKHGVLLYSNRPSGEIRPLPVSLDSEIVTYLKNRETLARVSGDGYYLVDGRKIITPLVLAKRPIGPKPDILVALSTSQLTPFPSLEIFVCEGGRGLDAASIMQGFGKPEPLDFRFPTGHPLTLSETSRSILATLELSYGMPATAVLPGDITIEINQRVVPLPSPELLNVISRPAEHEPFSFFISEWLMQSADALGESMVAAMPDHAMRELLHSLRVAKTLDSPWTRLTSQFVSTRREGGMIILKPASFGAADNFRVDRQALQEYLRVFARQEFPNLSEQIRYAERAPRLYRSGGLDMIWIQMHDPNLRIFEPWATEQRQAALRLMGLLGAELYSGGDSQIDLANLNSRQFECATEWVQLSRNHVPRSGGYSYGPDRPEESDMEFALPKPVTRVGKIYFTRKEMEGVLAMSPPSTVLPLTAPELGFRRGALPANTTGFELSGFNTFRSARIDGVNIYVSMNVGASMYMNREFRDIHSLGAKSKFLELPDGFREKVDRFAKDAATIRVAIPNYGGGSSAPPPQYP